ncbi:hypothetical protein KR032_000407 [Drosophila birchii]|nr:hypothetical protein KR032_000407 [Drosophila birchii]
MNIMLALRHIFSSNMVLPCVLCGSSEREEVIFGELGFHDTYMLHRNCLVLCLGKFIQNRITSFRLWNFLKKDILIQKNRFALVKCTYCPRLGANLSCSHEGCQRSFHTKCGVKNLAVLQYGGRFDSYCEQHVPDNRIRPGPDENCVLCLAPIVADGKDFSPALAFQAPCCQNGWFHRECVQVLSIATTYYFKCPLCRNENQFAEVATFGIAIPKWRYALPKPPAAMAMRVTRSAARSFLTGRLLVRAPRVRIARLTN